MPQMWKINVKSISCIAEEVLTSVFDVDANEARFHGSHREIV